MRAVFDEAFQRYFEGLIREGGEAAHHARPLPPLRPVVARPAMRRPYATTPDPAQVGRMAKSIGKHLDPPEGYVKYRGETWNRWHGLSEFKIKYHKRSYHLGYFPWEMREQGALKYDRWAVRLWGSAAVLNFPDHPQLEHVAWDGTPRDPFRDQVPEDLIPRDLLPEGMEP
jgi:hypothetical protein